MHTLRKKFTCETSILCVKLISHTEFHMLNIFHMYFTCISHTFHTFAPGSGCATRQRPRSSVFHVYVKDLPNI